MAAPSFENFSALVIDDEKFTRTVLARMLTNLGFKAVFQAEDGSTGMTAVRDLQPDVVICDVEMRPVNGIDFLQHLREGPEETLRRLPVVFITNRIDPDVLTQAHALGSDTFILKPVTPTLLKEKLLEGLHPA